MLLGHIDLVDRHRIRGWAADTDRPYGTIEVAVFVAGRLVGLARADHARNDLKDAGSLGSGMHGIAYTFEPPLSPAQGHEVVVRFADGGKLLGQWRVEQEAEAGPELADATPDEPVAGQPKVLAPEAEIISGALPGHVAISFVDECTRRVVKGWAASETNPDEVFDISIFVDDEKVAQLAANMPREDLAQTGQYGDGARGFLYRFNPPLPADRDVRVTVTYSRTGVPLTHGNLRLVGDQANSIAPLPALDEGEPRLLPAPTDPRQLFDIMGMLGGEEDISSLLGRLIFTGATPEKIHHAVFAAYPESVKDVLSWGTYYARDHLHQLLISETFQRRLIPLVLRAYPEKRRLIFVHIPKCAGTDLTFHFRARYPSIDRTLTDPDWTSKVVMLRRLARVVAHLHASDSIFTHGHINLSDYIDDGLIRPGDRVFTVLREPLAIAISQINYVLTRFSRDIAEGTQSPDTLEWSRVMELGPLPARMSDDFMRRVTRAVLHNEALLPPNSLGTWLGGKGSQAVLDRLVRYNVEVTDIDHYNRWLKQAWGIVAETRWNESTKFVSLESLSPDDIAHLNKITSEDRRLYGVIEDAFETTGKFALGSDDLRDVIGR